MTTAATERPRVEAGIYREMPWEQYKASRGLNASILKHGRTSMKHLRHAIDNPKADTPSMMFGRAVHTMLFEPLSFDARYAVWEGEARRGKEWLAFQEANAGKEILKIAEAEEATKAAQSAVDHPLIAELIGEGMAEASLFWEDFGMPCKGRIDWIQTHASTPRCILDVKTAVCIEHFKFGRQFYDLGYHISLGWYRRGVRKVLGVEVPVYVCAIENSPPYDVVRVPIPEAVLELGETQAGALAQQVAHCKMIGKWPGIADDSDYELDFPVFAMPDEEVPFNG